MPELATEAEATGNDDIRAMVSGLVDEADAPAKVETPVSADPVETHSDTRERNPDGTFKARSGDTEQVTEAAAEAPETPLAETVTDAPAAAQTTAEPPPTWNAEHKALFAKQTPEAQAFLLDRHRDMEADYTRKTQQLASFRQDFEPVQQLMAPHMDAMRQAGMTPARMVQAWMGVEHRFMNGDGVNAIRDIAKAYKIDLAQVASGSPPAVQPGQVDPTAAVDPTLQPLVQQIQALTQDANQRHQRDAQAEINRANAAVDTFRAAVDDKGQPLHPHFAEVEQMMTRLAIAARQAGEMPDLNAIYEQAVYATPSVREKVLAAANAAQRAKADAEARAKAATARKAASSTVTGGPGPGQAAKPRGNPNLSLRDEVAAIAAEIDSQAA